MRYVVIITVILAGIAASLGVYFTNKPQGIQPQEIQMGIARHSGITFRIDSIVNKQVFVTHLETQDKIVLEPNDLIIVNRQ